jgi:hypothetical protein
MSILQNAAGFVLSHVASDACILSVEHASRIVCSVSYVFDASP